MNNTHSFFSRVCRPRIPLLTVALVAMAWTSLATPLSEVNAAAMKGDLAKVKALLKGNPDLIFSKASYGEMPLHWAAMGGHKDVVEFLLANNASVNATNTLGWTSLHFAASDGHNDMAELLLAHEADVNAKNSEGETPLHWAARNGHKDVVKLLLANNADVNAKDNKGITPLNLAAFYDH